MLAVVLAAGRGTRLGPLTADRSKAMMPIVGRPMIGHVVDMLLEGGLSRLVVVAHPDDAELADYVYHPSFPASVRLAYQEERMGMAHAVACAAPLIREAAPPDFILASCDNLYPRGHIASLLTCRRQAELDAALTLLWTSRDEATASAVVVLRDGWVTDIIEKPGPDDIPSYGGRNEALSAPSLYALTPQVLEVLGQVRESSRGEREFPDALRLLIAEGGRVAGQEVRTRRVLTRPQDLLDLNLHALRSDPACAVIKARVPSDSTVVPPVRIEEDVVVGRGCRIGPHTYLESGCRVGARAVVRRSVVMRGANVESNTLVEESVVSRGGAVP